MNYNEIIYLYFTPYFLNNEEQVSKLSENAKIPNGVKTA